MLNFLKKIRSKLLEEGNLKKYLAYAVGEIIIVVIGILLALYLNNWNQKRTNDKLEIQYYQSMKNQLNEDLNTLVGEMDYNQKYLNQFSYAKKLILLNDKSKIIGWIDFYFPQHAFIVLISKTPENRPH